MIALLALCPVLHAPAQSDPSGEHKPQASLPPATAAASLPLESFDARPDRSLTLFFENDGTFIKPNRHTDRHYTSGQGFAFAWHDDAGRNIADALGLAPDSTALGLTLVQQIFTPGDIREVPVNPNDRPYAGYLYLGGFVQFQNENTLDHVELDLGVVGPSSLAEATQEVIHDITDSPDPNWQNQLEDEAAVNINYRRLWRYDLTPPSQIEDVDTLHWQLLPEMGFDLGTVYRRVHGGATLRAGINLPDDFGPGKLTAVGSAAGLPVRGFSVYGFGQALGRYNEWNTFIEGSNWQNPSAAVSLEPFTAELALGFAIEWRKNNWVFQTAYRQTYYTNEFEEQSTDDLVGSVAIRFRYEF